MYLKNTSQEFRSKNGGESIWNQENIKWQPLETKKFEADVYNICVGICVN